jgi:hypothetical protein
MKSIFSSAAFTALLAFYNIAPTLAGNEIDGEAEIKDAGCEMFCEWTAKASGSRRLTGRSLEAEKKFVRDVLEGRRLGASLKDVECEITLPDGTSYSEKLSFPDGWVRISKEADGADDYYFFGTSFEYYDATSGDLIGTGALEVEIEVGDDGLPVYDDSDIGVECALTEAPPGGEGGYYKEDPPAEEEPAAEEPASEAPAAP